MKILFVLEYYAPYIGGAESLFRTLCEGLASRGHKITVLTRRFGTTKEQEVINNVDIRRIRTFNRLGFAFIAWLHVWRFARKVDLVHTATFLSAFPAWFGVLLARKPCSITVHEVWGDFWKRIVRLHWIWRYIERFILNRSFKVFIANSNYTKKQLVSVRKKPAKIEVVYPGLDYEIFNPENVEVDWLKREYDLKNNDVFLYFGRPGYSKGVVDLIQIWARYASVNPNARLVLLMSGSPEVIYRKIQMLIDKLDIRASIIEVDSVSKKGLVNYIGGADCVIVPSESEGFGFSALEAAAVGKPLIVRKVASLPEVLSEYEGVTYFTTQDECIAQMSAVLKMRKSYAPYKAFGIPEMIDAHDKIFRSILKS